MEARGRLIAALVALVVVLTGAVMFLMGRMSAGEGTRAETASPTINAAAPPAAVQGDSSTGSKDPVAAPTPAPAAAAADPAPPPPAEEPGIIPATFHGEWNRELAHCGTGLNDSALRIEPRAMRFYESRGDVIRVRRTGERSVSVEASFQGEGESWTETVRLTLSPRSDQLSVGQDRMRRRCD
ncbi:MAG: hypothetical protein M3177_07830 [Pseudomonadota bacterium]|nr:hypothetical protein [Pseudomonadota bacterium]